MHLPEPLKTSERPNKRTDLDYVSRLLGRGCSCFAVACGAAVLVPLEDDKEYHPQGQSNVGEDCNEPKCLCVYICTSIIILV